jgi:transposase-like protein
MRDTPVMREMSVVEQRYQAVLAVIDQGETVTSVAGRFGVSRKTVHVWLARCEAGGLENLADREGAASAGPEVEAVSARVTATASAPARSCAVGDLRPRLDRA